MVWWCGGSGWWCGGGWCIILHTIDYSAVVVLWCGGMVVEMVLELG